MLHPRPAHRASYPLLCTISPRFRLRPSLRSPRGDTVALGYPSALPAWGRTCPLYTYRIFVTLDAVLKSGTLAERPDKRPGIPGTQQCDHPTPIRLRLRVLVVADVRLPSTLWMKFV